MLKQLDKWHKTKRGYLTFGALELVLSYIVGSLAIGNGSLLFYGATLLLLCGAVANFVKSTRVKNAKPRSKKTA